MSLFKRFTEPKKTINIENIYVGLLNEGIEVFRPVKAEHLYVDVWRISEQVIPEGETWEFQPGQKVNVKGREIEGVWSLVAYKRPPLSKKYWFRGIRDGAFSTGFVPANWKGCATLAIIVASMFGFGYLIENPIPGWGWIAFVPFVVACAGILLAIIKTDRTDI